MPGPPPPPRPFLQQVSAGGAVRVPAHETEMRGPQLLKAQQHADTDREAAIQDVSINNRLQAQNEYDLAVRMEQAAKAREDAAAYSAAQRAAELQQRQADFDDSAKALAQTAINPDRFWSNQSTGTKVGYLIASVLSDLKPGGGPNAGLDMIQRGIDRDIKAQEFQYNATRDTLNAKQTAFSMAMQRYNNEDAARAAVRAAALDAAAAQVAQQSALAKGTDAQNRAADLLQQLNDRRTQQIAQGVAFTPATTVQVGARYMDPRTGFVYSEQEAKGLAAKADEREFRREEIGLNTAGDILKEGAKGDRAAEKDQRALSVQLPNGDVVKASDPDQAHRLRAASASIHETERLVREAKEIRAGNSFRIPGSPARARLEQIQKNLITQYAVQNNLGAISGPDMDLAVGGTAKLFDVGPGPEATLDALSAGAQAKLRAEVKTIPDAPGSAKGEMPKSFTPHGAK